MTRKILFTLITFSFLFVCFSAFPAGVNAQTKKELKDAKDLSDEGDKALGKRDFQLAITKYGQSIAIVPNNGYAHFWKGHAHYQLKEYDKAIPEFDTALAQGFKADQVLGLRWYANYETKSYDAALRDINTLLGAVPSDVTLLIAAGDVHLAKKAYPEALAAYQNAATAAPTNADVQYYLANTYSFLGKFNEQGTAAEAAVRRNTRHLGEAYFLLGDSYQKQRKLPEAAEAFKKSVAARPNNYDGYRRLADVYRGQGRFKDAIETLKSSNKFFGSPKGETYTELSWYYSLTNREEDAVEAAKAGVQLTPSNFAAHTNLCRAYNGVKQYQLAIASCNTALRLQPNDGETYFYLGRAQDSTGKSADATRSYKKAVLGLTAYTKANPDFTDGFYLLANALTADNQLDKAVAANMRAIELSPGFAKARYNLAIVYLAQKKKPLAVEQYDELVKLDTEQAAKLKVEIDK